MSKNGKKHAYGDANPLEIVLGTATNRWVEDPREALRVDEHFHLASMDRAATVLCFIISKSPCTFSFKSSTGKTFPDPITL